MLYLSVKQYVLLLLKVSRKNATYTTFVITFYLGCVTTIDLYNTGAAAAGILRQQIHRSN